MPMTRITIEEVGAGRWVAEVEGGRPNRRAVRRAETFDSTLDEVRRAYHEVIAPEAAAVVDAPRRRPAKAHAQT